MEAQTRYAATPNGSVAYQVFGHGQRDIAFMPGVVSHLDLLWTDPDITRFLRRVASLGRVVAFDRLGVGLSDRVTTVPSLEQRARELGAVLDACGMDSVTVIGFSESGAAAAYFGATHPGRVRSLVLASAIVKGVDPTSSWGLHSGLFDRLDEVIEHWGEGRSLELLAPSMAGSTLNRRLWGTFERAAAGPGAVRPLLASIEHLDVAAVLDTIDVPTLVVAFDNDPVIPLEQAQQIAGRVPHAELVVVPGDDHLPWTGDIDAYLDPIEAFITGAAPARAGDRMFATVLFTDIVESTKRLAELGDEAWAQLVGRHDAVTRQLLERHGGREVKTLGDGFLAVFGGPQAAVACAEELAIAVTELGLQIRAGIHAGEVQLIGTDVSGLAVNTAARIAATARPTEILVSPAVRDLLIPSGGAFDSRGAFELKGLGTMELFTARQQGQIAVADEPQHFRVGDRTTLRIARRLPGAARWSVRVLRRGERAPVGA